MWSLTLSFRILLFAFVILAFDFTDATADNFISTHSLSQNHVQFRLKVQERFLLLPVEESRPNVQIRIIGNNIQLQTLNVRLAQSHADYYVPLDVTRFGVSSLLFDVTRRETNDEKPLSDAVCWQLIRQSRDFDTLNVEPLRPAYHHTPPYGWMNDPNGMFFKDGLWHLCYQWNPYGSTWENMTWGHAVSRDLLHWLTLPAAIEPDAHGVIYSGSCAVIPDSRAGSPGDVVAIYTSRGVSQTQSVAFSHDGGQTFCKHSENPVLTGTVRDFRDPKIFWNEETARWNVVLAAGDEVQFFSSANLTDWTFESSFGKGYGCHDAVWECPDLVKIPVRGSEKKKWLLIVNIFSGGPAGGSATQYFVGDFDGHVFNCDSSPETVKWMDYGKDHYATVTFNNAPDGRVVALAWMSNWQYANQVPTMQYRSANSIPRDLFLFDEEGQTYCGVEPSREILQARGKPQRRLSDACEIVVTPRDGMELTLSNQHNESVYLKYDAHKQTFSMDRRQSGRVAFSKHFACVTTAPTFGRVRTFRIFIDRCSIEIFDADGRFAMTNLVFPTSPYSELKIRNYKSYVVYPIN